MASFYDSCFLIEEYDGKKHQPSIFVRRKRHYGDKLCLYISRNFKVMNIFLALPIGTALVEWSLSP